MKIAFCLSGHLRTYDKCIESFLKFKNYVNNFGDIDTFISTWEETSNFQDSLHEYDNSSHEEKICDINKIKNYYNPLSISFHSYGQVENNLIHNFFKPNFDFTSIGGRYSKLNIPHHMRAFYLLYQVSQLREHFEKINNFKYDIIFRIRPDYEFNDTYKILNLSNIEKNTFYSYYHFHNDIDDQFGYSDSSTFSKYSKIFFNLERIGKTFIETIGHHSYTHPEMIIYCNSQIEDFKYFNINRIGHIVR
jgi:hypothetical protein